MKWLLAILISAAGPALAQQIPAPDSRVAAYQDLYKEATERLVEWRAQAIVLKDQAQQFAKQTEALIETRKADEAEIAKLQAELKSLQETKPPRAPTACAAPTGRSDPE